ncbi:unnamed protein product [Dicrocoelium dendriticum]|nr:unnamed protein product [Dicrocoelium dendriticum]
MNNLPVPKTTAPDSGPTDAFDMGLYKSQPTALNLTRNIIPEDSVWNSTPMMCGTGNIGDTEKPADGMVLEIEMDEIRPITPPDGGWGWFIVLGSFMCMFLVDGVCFSYGIFLSELEATFGASKMQMTLAGSLLTGCYFMVGPLVSGLMNRFGARKLVVIGSIVSSAAIFCSSFATNVNTFIGLFGVIGGIGYGLLYLPAATIVTSWFLKKRATVTGIVMAGSSIGVTFYSIAIPHLISWFTWRGCILILSAMNLNAAVAGVLFRPLSSVYPQSTKEKRKHGADGLASPLVTSELGGQFDTKATARFNDPSQVAEVQRRASVQVSSFPPYCTPRYMHLICNAITSHGNQLVPVPEGSTLTISAADHFPLMSVETVNLIVEDVLNRQPFVSATSLAISDKGQVVRKPSNFIGGSSRWLSSTASQLSSQQVTVRPTDKAVVYLKPDNTGSTLFFASALSLRAGTDAAAGPIDESAVRGAIIKELRKEVSRPVHRKDLFLSGSVFQLDEYLASPTADTYIRTVTAQAEEVQARNPIMAMLRSMFGLSLLRSPSFQLLNVSGVITVVGYIVPYQFLKDNAQVHGYGEKESAYLLAYLGVLNTISRLVSGWFSDQPWTDVLVINNVALVLSGIATAMVPLFTTYAGMLSYACFFGFVVAAFIVVRTILTVKILGLDRLTNAFGFFLLFQGLAIVGAPPLLSSLYDTFRTFDYTFIFGGLALFVSGVICFPLGAVARWEHRKEIGMTGADDLENLGKGPFALTKLVRRMRDFFSRRRYSRNHVDYDYTGSVDYDETCDSRVMRNDKAP